MKDFRVKTERERADGHSAFSVQMRLLNCWITIKTYRDWNAFLAKLRAEKLCAELNG